MKTCSSCKKVLPFESFNKCKTGTFGLQGYCKTCKKSLNHKYDAKRSAKKSIYNKNRWGKIKDNPQRIAYHKKWLEDNKDHVSEKAKEYYQKNKQYVLVYNSNERAKKIGLSEMMSQSEWKFVVELADYKCLSCELSEYLSLDHVVPLSKGGENNILNVQPLCLRCHMKKGVRVVDFRNSEFIERVKQKYR